MNAAARDRAFVTSKLGVAYFLFLVGVILVGFGALDHFAGQGDARPAASAAPRFRAERSRVFVFFVDSLRYETATDERLMPRLARLREESTFARVETTRDAVTVPAIRAAFSGRERTAILGFAGNFLRGDAGVESLFSQMTGEGLRASVYSEGAFDQFGGDVERRSNTGLGANAVDAQNDALRDAVKEYRGGRPDVVVAHINYTDLVAHQGGIANPLYAASYRVADEIIERLVQVIAPGDSFVVMGDHGHDATGRHAIGLDVPTFALYHGTLFRPGHDLGTMRITDHRYLMSWALGLPLAADYEGEPHPDALVAEAVPAAYLGSIGTRRRARDALPCDALGAVVLLGAFAFLGWRALTVDERASGSWRRDLRALAWALTLALLACGWGYALVRARVTLHELGYTTLFVVWVGVLGAACAVARWRRDPVFGWYVLMTPLLIFFPTVYRYGAVAAMAPAWSGWAVVTIAHAASFGGDGADRTPTIVKALLVAGTVLLMFLLPFKAVEAVNFAFVGWLSWPIGVIRGGWIGLALIAKLIVFVRPRAGAWATLASLFIVTVLFALELGVVSFGRSEVLIAVAVGVAAGALHRAARRWPSMREPARLSLLVALYIAYHATVRAPRVASAWMDVLLAAIVVSAWIARRSLSGEALSRSRAVLTAFSLVAAGWVTLAWGVHWLEWRFLYDWFDASFVERHVGYFVPLIVLRYAIPLILGRILLAEQLDPVSTYPRRAIWLMAGAKGFALLFFTYGIGLGSVASDVYLEAAEETGIFAILCAGLV